MSRFLSFDRSPCVARNVGAMLVSTVHRGIDRHFPIDQPGGICPGQQRGKDLVPSPVAAVTAVAFPDRLPRTEVFRQVPPRDPCPIPVDDALCHEPVILERTAQLPRRYRHQRGNLLPLDIGQGGITRTHSSILRTHQPNHWETRPRAHQQPTMRFGLTAGDLTHRCIAHHNE